MGICFKSQETQTGALFQPRGVGSEEEGSEVQMGGVYVYLCLIHV